jgi:UDP-N-acetylmuramoyl-tripeptide--D-alanyl-D-alanine ligase
MNIKAIHQLFLQSNSVCTDTRKIIKDAMYFALKGENFNGNTFAQNAIELGAKYVIIDEAEFNISTETILVNNVLETLQELAAFHRAYLKLPIIAITGSNGKTTTKELINATLSQKFNTVATIGNLNNHIGVPLTLLSMDSKTEIGIVEMGANHLNEIEFLCSIAKPDYGYITNFGKAHLEGFGSIEGVIQGKSELYKYLIKHNKTIFVNGNDKIQIERTQKANTYTFGTIKDNSNIIIDLINAHPFVKVLYNNLEIQSQLIGTYNFSNISAAIAIGNYFKVGDSEIKLAIENYVPTNNRSQITEKGTNTIILDAYNANPTSMEAALRNFEKQEGFQKIAILGDMFELGNEAEKEHQAIIDLVSTMLLDQVIVIGKHFFETKIVSTKIVAFKAFEEFKDNFDFSQIKNTTLLIKASRGMALERILDII